MQPPIKAIESDDATLWADDRSGRFWITFAPVTDGTSREYRFTVQDGPKRVHVQFGLSAKDNNVRNAMVAAALKDEVGRTLFSVSSNLAAWGLMDAGDWYLYWHRDATSFVIQPGITYTLEITIDSASEADTLELIPRIFGGGTVPILGD